MAQTLQHKRGITAELAPQVGTIGEIMMDTAKNTLVIMDGVTAGGHPMAKESDVPTDISDLTDTQGLLSGGTGGANLQDIVVTSEGSDGDGFTKLSLANKDFTIETTRANSDQDADINLSAADDIWIEAYGDDVHLTANDAVRIHVADYTKEWTFDRTGNLTLPEGGDILNSNGVSVLGEVAGDPNIWIETFSSDQPTTDFIQAATSVEYDAAGNIVALFNHVIPSSNYETYTSVAKFTPTGVVMWKVRFGTNLNTDGWGLAYDTTNNYVYVAGKTSGGLLNYQFATLTKIDGGNGLTSWSKTYDFEANSSSAVVDVDSDGNPVMVGYSSNGTDDYIVTTKVDKTDGSVIWSRIIDGQGYDQAYGMGIGPNNEVVTVGYIDTFSPEDTDDRMIVIKYAANGTIAWQKAVQFEVGYNCSGADADIDSSGNIYVCGQYSYSTGDNTDSAMSLVKFDGNGVKQWSRRVVGDCESFGTSVVVGDDGFLYLSGITGTNSTSDYTWVVAKYDTDGIVVWQRLIDNVSNWTFGGSFWFGNNGGGSNLAVRNGYIALAGAFGNPFSNSQATATVLQIDTDATLFTIGDWDFKAATFSGLLNSTASDITVVDADKPENPASPNAVDFAINADLSNFLNVTRVGDTAGDSINNGQYSVSIDTNGVVTMSTSRGNLEFGALPEPGGPSHFHIMRAVGDSQDLYFGDDYNYMLQPGASIYGVEIGTNDNNGGSQHVWRFGTNGTMTFPTLTVPISDNANPSGTGQTIKFSDPSQQAIIYGPSSTVDFPNAERVIIQGAPGYANTSGEGGDVYLWAGPGGDTNGDGGDIKIRGGRGDGTGNGGYLNFQAGDSGTGSGGWINIESGETGTYGSGGDVTVQARSGGEITLRTRGSQSNDNDWQFTNTGTTIFPGAIVKSTIAKTGVDINSNNVLFEVTQVNGSGAVTEITVTNSPNPAWTTTTSGSSLGDVNFTVSFDGSGNATVTVDDTNYTFSGANGDWTYSNFGNTNPVTQLDFGDTPGALSNLLAAGGIPIGTQITTTGMGGGVVETTSEFTLSGGVWSASVNVISGPPFGAILSVSFAAAGGGAGHSIGETFVLQPATVGATVPTPTPLDLTKSVNKLTNGVYTLADGVEGQIMYLVRQTGSAYNQIIVNVANGRVDGALYTTIDHYPFENVSTPNMSTLIFTDGAWQSSNGGWD
jgi:hypothetical protein